MPPKKQKSEEKPQSERFIETAREVEADETDIGFDKAFRALRLLESPKLEKKLASPRATRPKGDQ